jgi:hypothetical protein
LFIQVTQEGTGDASPFGHLFQRHKRTSNLLVFAHVDVAVKEGGERIHNEERRIHLANGLFDQWEIAWNGRQ